MSLPMKRYFRFVQFECVSPQAFHHFYSVVFCDFQAPGGVASAPVYTQLLTLYLLQNDMWVIARSFSYWCLQVILFCSVNAKFLWKRIPPSIKTVINQSIHQSIYLMDSPPGDSWTLSNLDGRPKHVAARFPENLRKSAERVERVDQAHCGGHHR
jgi:hypothetical protein